MRSAEGLEELAEHALRLPDDDERLRGLIALSTLPGRFAPPMGEGIYGVARFRFHNSDADCDRFLTWLVKTLKKDAGRLRDDGGEPLRDPARGRARGR